MDITALLPGLQVSSQAVQELLQLAGKVQAQVAGFSRRAFLQQVVQGLEQELRMGGPGSVGMSNGDGR
jgi:hypothetical protein